MLRKHARATQLCHRPSVASQSCREDRDKRVTLGQRDDVVNHALVVELERGALHQLADVPVGQSWHDDVARLLERSQP